MRGPFDIKGKNEDSNDDDMMMLKNSRLVAKCRPLRALKSAGRMVSPCSQKFVSRPCKVLVEAERLTPVPALMPVAEPKREHPRIGNKGK